MPTERLSVRRGRLTTPLLLLLSAVGGAATLSYEVAWTHSLALAVGNSSRALAVVLSGFLGGMALGGWLAARSPFRLRRPLLLCAALELTLGACGLLYPTLLATLPEAVAGLVRAGWSVPLARTLMVVAVLLPPTVAMGMTFPLWVRALMERGCRSTGRAAALVSAAQVVGAASGALGAGFLVVPAFGYAAASQLAGFGGGFVGLCLLWIGRGATRPADEESTDRSRGRVAAGSFGPAFVLCGFASIGYQVVWTRSLVFFFDGFHYAFSAVLVSFLTGLGAGAAMVAVIAPRVKNPDRMLGVCQVLCAIAGLISLLVVPWVGGLAAQAAGDAGGYPLRVLALSFVMLFLPSAMLGTTLPLATWVATRAVGRLAAGLSGAYARVTFGNAVAAGVVPLLLIPAVGIRTAWAGLVVINGVTGVLLARGKGTRIAGLLVAAVGVAAVVWTQVAPRPLVLSSQVFAGRRGESRELLSSVDGESATVSVVRDANRGTRVLYTDTFAAASTGREYPYMRLLGHLPVLLTENPARTLVICFGTGTTAGAVSLHEDVRSLRVVDVEREVFRVADAFSDVNHDVLHGRAGLHLEPVVEDGRLDLLCADRPYDVITLEPLMPYTLGAAPFYTEEFYELARDRLAEGGVVCQWIPVHAIPVDDYRGLVRTFISVFPEGHLFFFEQSSLLVARRGGSPPVWEEVVRRSAASEVAADLREALVAGPQDLLAAHVASGATLQSMLGSGDVLTDDRPWVAFRSVRPEANPRQPLRDTLEFLVACAQAERQRNLAPDLVRWSGAGRSVIGPFVEVRRRLLRGRELEAETWLRGATTGEGVSFRAAMDVYAGALASMPEHLEAERLLARLSFMFERQSAMSDLVAGRPLDAFTRLDRFRGTDEWDLGAESTQALALLAAGDAAGALAISQRVVRDHDRHELAVAVLERAAVDVDDPEAVAMARSSALKVSSDGLSARRELVERVRRASRADGLAPLRALRERLDEVCGADILGDPGTLGRAMDALAVDRQDPLWSLLGAVSLRSLDEEPPSSAAIREVAVMGVRRALPRLREVEARHPSLELDARRAQAALVPRDSAEFTRLKSDDDVAVRRQLTASCGRRGALVQAASLLSALMDEDEDVRLYADRALRRLTSKNVGYDYLAKPAEREAGMARWQASLR